MRKISLLTYRDTYIYIYILAQIFISILYHRQIKNNIINATTYICIRESITSDKDMLTKQDIQTTLDINAQSHVFLVNAEFLKLYTCFFVFWCNSLGKTYHV